MCAKSIEPTSNFLLLNKLQHFCYDLLESICNKGV